MERKYDKKVKGLKDHLRARGSDVCEDGDPLVGMSMDKMTTMRMRMALCPR